MSGRTALLVPSLANLPAFAAALEAGWSPDNIRGGDAAREQLQRIREDPEAFVARQDDPEARGGPVTLPDGSQAPRLPGFLRWIWDGEFCGVIGLRWQNGTSTLPDYVLGHIGFAVVPWKRGRGHATRALGLLLPEARVRSLSFVELTCDPDNGASQHVITANSGYLVERFTKLAVYGGGEALRYRIDL